MRVLFKTIYYASLVAMSAVALLVLGSLFSTIPGAFQVKIVQSGSMEPAIKTGSIVIIQPRSSYQANDIITFYESGEGSREKELVPTTHRVISERVANGVPLYTTQGDANNTPDPREVPELAIVGKVLLSLPFVGFFLDFARQPLGFALLVGIPAALVVVDAVSVIWSEVRRLRARRREESREKSSATKDKQRNT